MKTKNVTYSSKIPETVVDLLKRVRFQKFCRKCPYVHHHRFLILALVNILFQILVKTGNRITIQEIKEHEFFKPLDLLAMEKRTLTAPFIPVSI